MIMLINKNTNEELNSTELVKERVNISNLQNFNISYINDEYDFSDFFYSEILDEKYNENEEFIIKCEPSELGEFFDEAKKELVKYNPLLFSLYMFENNYIPSRFYTKLSGAQHRNLSKIIKKTNSLIKNK